MNRAETEVRVREHPRSRLLGFDTTGRDLTEGDHLIQWENRKLPGPPNGGKDMKSRVHAGRFEDIGHRRYANG